MAKDRISAREDQTSFGNSTPEEGRALKMERYRQIAQRHLPGIMRRLLGDYDREKVRTVLDEYQNIDYLHYGTARLVNDLRELKRLGVRVSDFEGRSLGELIEIHSTLVKNLRVAER